METNIDWIKKICKPNDSNGEQWRIRERMERKGEQIRAREGKGEKERRVEQQRAIERKQERAREIRINKE